MRATALFVVSTRIFDNALRNSGRLLAAACSRKFFAESNSFLSIQGAGVQNLRLGVMRKSFS